MLPCGPKNRKTVIFLDPEFEKMLDFQYLEVQGKNQKTRPYTAVQGKRSKEEFYPDEIREIILSELESSLANMKDGSRRAIIIKDIIDNNDYRHVQSEREQKLKMLLKDYKNLSGPVRQSLCDLGFEITEDGKHYKLTYYGDDRFWTTLSKTASDHKTGLNAAAEIKKGML